MPGNDEILGEPRTMPADILSKIVSSLRQAHETDTALLDVLSNRILMTKPAATAVNDALNDIEKLASLRAKGTQSDTSNHS